MSKTDYKSKYIDIRDKFIESTDVAYRMGFEHGMEEGQKQAEQQAQQMQQEMAAQQAQAMREGELPPEQGGEMPPEAMEEGQPQEELPPEQMGEEEAAQLDDRINELESLVAKGEKPKVTDLRKAVIELADLRKKQKESFTKKSRKTVSKQKQFVDSIISKWEDESKSVTDDLESVLKEKGINLDD